MINDGTPSLPAACLPVLPCLALCGHDWRQGTRDPGFSHFQPFPSGEGEAPEVGQGDRARAKDEISIEKRAHRQLHQHAFGSRHIPQAK
jgi:hypothetical protein